MALVRRAACFGEVNHVAGPMHAALGAKAHFGFVGGSTRSSPGPRPRSSRSRTSWPDPSGPYDEGCWRAKCRAHTRRKIDGPASRPGWQVHQAPPRHRATGNRQHRSVSHKHRAWARYRAGVCPRSDGRSVCTSHPARLLAANPARPSRSRSGRRAASRPQVPGG